MKKTWFTVLSVCMLAVSQPAAAAESARPAGRASAESVAAVFDRWPAEKQAEMRRLLVQISEMQFREKMQNEPMLEDVHISLENETDLRYDFVLKKDSDFAKMAGSSGESRQFGRFFGMVLCEKLTLESNGKLEILSAAGFKNIHVVVQAAGMPTVDTVMPVNNCGGATDTAAPQDGKR